MLKLFLLTNHRNFCAAKFKLEDGEKMCCFFVIRLLNLRDRNLEGVVSKRCGETNKIPYFSLENSL